MTSFIFERGLPNKMIQKNTPTRPMISSAVFLCNVKGDKTASIEIVNIIILWCNLVPGRFEASEGQILQNVVK